MQSTDETGSGGINQQSLPEDHWAISLSPLYRPSSTRLSRFLLFSVESDKVVSFRTPSFRLGGHCGFDERLAEEALAQRISYAQRSVEIRVLQVYSAPQELVEGQFCVLSVPREHQKRRHNYLNYEGWTNTRHTLESFFETELTPPLCA